MEHIGEYRGVRTYVHDAVVMEKVCHAIVDDVGNDNVFWEKEREERHGEY